MLRASLARAFYTWKNFGLAMKSVLEVQTTAARAAGTVSLCSGVIVLERMERKRSCQRLRSCLDKWFLAVHSKELQVNSHRIVIHINHVLWLV